MVIKRISRIISTLTASLLLAGGLAGVASAAAPSTVYVSANTNKCSDAGPGTQQVPYCTVQKGVDSVAAGGTVNVGAGTYTEKVVITKNNITVDGVGNGSNITIPQGVDGKIVDINAKNVTLRDLKVNGPFTFGGCTANGEFGVYFENNASATIENSQVVSIKEANPALEGCQQGIGIRAGSEALGIKATATIANNKISDYQKGGIVIDGPNTTGDVHNNTVDGIAPSNITARNGIQLGRGASGSIVNNIVRNNSYTPQTTSATGILIFSSANITKNLTVSQNTVNNNDVGLDIDSRNSIYSQNVANNNVFNGFYVESTAKNNTFTQNTVRGTSGANAPFTSIDIQDDSAGNGSLGTANTYSQNGCKTSDPAQLCKI